MIYQFTSPFLSAKVFALYIAFAVWSWVFFFLQVEVTWNGKVFPGLGLRSAWSISNDLNDFYMTIQFFRNIAIRLCYLCFLPTDGMFLVADWYHQQADDFPRIAIGCEVLAMMNVVTGVFVESALGSAREDMRCTWWVDTVSWRWWKIGLFWG